MLLLCIPINPNHNVNSLIEVAARNRLLQLMEAAGIADPWSKAQRRRLSAVLFT